MASRWRSWDQQFAVDILHDPSSSSSVNRPCKSLGRGRIKLNICECSLPIVETIGKGSVRGSSLMHFNSGKYRCLGRGRGRKQHFNEVVQQSLASMLTQSSDSQYVKSSSCKARDEIRKKTKKENKSELEGTGGIFPKDQTSFEEKMEIQKQKLKDINENDLPELSTTFLKGLENKERWIILDGVSPRKKTTNEMIEIIEDFGKIESVSLYKGNRALIRMEDDLKCEWIISSIDGSQLSESSHTLSVLRVNDVLFDEMSQ